MHTTPFSQQLTFLNRGITDDELTEELASLVKAVRDTGKAGTLTVNIKVQMLNRRDEDAVKLTITHSNKLPQLDSPETVMFSTADGDLLRDDPRQRVFDLRSVDKGEEEPELRRAESKD